MSTFSNANDKNAITAISVKILFFLMKSIMNINNLLIKFLYWIINNLNHYLNYDEAPLAFCWIKSNTTLEYEIKREDGILKLL